MSNQYSLRSRPSFGLVRGTHESLMMSLPPLAPAGIRLAPAGGSPKTKCIDFYGRAKAARTVASRFVIVSQLNPRYAESSRLQQFEIASKAQNQTGSRWITTHRAKSRMGRCCLSNVVAAFTITQGGTQSQRPFDEVTRASSRHDDRRPQWLVEVFVRLADRVDSSTMKSERKRQLRVRRLRSAHRIIACRRAALSARARSWARRSWRRSRLLL